jgi:hypothetical protein
MAGSTESGQDIEAGRDNWSIDETRIWARRTDSDDADDYNGKAILVVEAARHVDDPEDVLDPEDFEFGDWHPQHPVDGIVGSGWSGSISDGLRSIGGVGVTGNGGTNLGTGVLGRGGGEKGTGGIGVHGIGGSQSEPSWDPTEPPGTGVLGQGGRQTKFNALRLPHGAGIIGFAGGSKKPIPPLADTGSVGVYGQGAEAEVRTIPIDTVDTVTGPMTPGPGVLGRGGVSDPRGRVAAGVIGLAGDVAIPPFSETADKGVYGKGQVGVYGQGGTGVGVVGISEPAVGVFGASNTDAGVKGSSAASNGGYFESADVAQVHLEPHDKPIADPNGNIAGRAGDLRAGSVCLDRFSGLIGGVSAGFRPPRSAAAE